MESLARRSCDVGRKFIWSAMVVLALATLLDAVFEFAWAAPSGWLWFDRRAFSGVSGIVAGCVFAMAVLLCPIAGRMWNRGVGLAALIGAVVCLIDAGRVAALAEGERIADIAPLSASAAVAVLLGAFAWTQRSGVQPKSFNRWTLLFAGPAALMMITFQMLTFGETDYRRPADAALVFGAKVHADGAPSGALADRVDAACRLWHDGLVSTLVLSGGRDDGKRLSEPEAMRERCLANGVPASALVLDETGINTLASIRFAADYGKSHEVRRWLMVSHDYHLARIKMLATRNGLESYTVPAREDHVIGGKWRFIAREVAAIVAWYAAPKAMG